MDELNKILKMYEEQEKELDTQLSKIKIFTEKKSCIKNTTILISLQEARERNEKILKNFELVKSNLRTKAIFSPVELQWDEICEKYLEEPSLMVTSWKCHLPVFV